MDQEHTRFFNHRLYSFIFLLLAGCFPVLGQLKLGSSQSEINFREGPGTGTRVLNTINSSNLLVILPGEAQNGFVQVFDIESSSFGYVYEQLIKVNDTLHFQKQHFFEYSDENSQGDAGIQLVNRTGIPLFVWINRISYNLSPYEKRELVSDSGDITYFSSSPGYYPVFGKEILKKGSKYEWSYTVSHTRARDTLRLDISRIEISTKTDTVYVFSSRVDTIALQPVKTDTSKVARDVNPIDLAGSKYKLRFMGNLRVNSYYDFTGMKSTEGFMPFDIPVGEDAIEGLSSVYVGARQSRLGVEGSGNTKVGQIKTYIEVDFASRSESLLRLRHAYAEWNFLKLGYSWSTFMDNASLPTTIDFEGPNSALNKRHGLIRYERKYGENSIAGISLESPQTDYYNPADSLITGKNKQGNFDIAGRFKQLNRLGHFQAAGILRRIEYLYGNKMDQLYGWGVLLSASVNFNKKNIISGQFSFGEGIANYYVGFADRQLDAVYDPNTLKMTLKLIRGGFVSYAHVFNPSWRFSVTSGTSYLKGKEYEPGDTFKSSRYFASNVFFNPIATIRVGAEVTTGSRTNLDSSKGTSTRISLIANFDF